MIQRTVEDRFWAKVDKRGPDECWRWIGSHGEQGYGQLRVGEGVGRLVKAHRLSYALNVGRIPEGREIDHLCRVTSCVNPGHLEPVTHQENIRRAWAAHPACHRGHAWTPANTYEGIRKSTGRPRRRCRQCELAKQQRRRLEAAS